MLATQEPARSSDERLDDLFVEALAMAILVLTDPRCGTLTSAGDVCQRKALAAMTEARNLVVCHD